VPTLEELVPPQDLLPHYAQRRSFMKAGDRFLEAAASRGLEPHHRVLDIGCGVGRFAVALAGYLDERGSYVGIDTHAPSIRLCRKYIGRKLDRFRFKRVPFGEAATLRFPFRSASFDFAFSNSLFTHLKPEIAENYLLEIGRVLRPKGRAFNTMFLLNDDSVALLDANSSTHEKTYPFGDGRARVKQPERPQGWIAHQEGFIRSVHERAHLEIEPPIRYGAWPGREPTGPGFGEKDIVVAVRGRWGIPHLLRRGTQSRRV
jgi:ubiquinone/menaquinone biosynthesis C-methylase UbiE